MKIIQLLCLFLLIGETAVGHNDSNEGKISGKILDENNIEIPGASVILRTISDSTIVKVEQSLSDGSFNLISVPTGNYVVEIIIFGYNKSYREAQITASAREQALGNIRLNPNNVNLKEIEIKEHVFLVEKKANTSIYNIDKSAGQIGNSAMEIIKDLPGINMDNQGNIMLNGKRGVAILVNGKTVAISGGQDISNILSTYQSNNIQKVEVSTIPSSNQDSEGGAGTINIITKKNKLQGINGDITFGAAHGKYPKGNIGTNINFNQNKLSLLFNYSNSIRKTFSDLTLTRKLHHSDTLQSVLYSATKTLFEAKTHNMRFGAEYLLNERNSFSFSCAGLMNNYTPKTKAIMRVYNDNNEYDGLMSMSSLSDDHFNNYSGSASFRHQIDTMGSTLSADLDYAIFMNGSDQTTFQNTYDQSGSTINSFELLSNQQGSINIYSAKSDLHYVFDKMTVDGGLKSSYVKRDNGLLFKQEYAGQMVYDPLRSNYFVYHENTNALYVSTALPYKKYNIVCGLRLENTNLIGEQKNTGFVFNNNYYQLFPNLSIEKEIKEKHHLSVSCARRINRPHYRLLNPFRFYIDPSSYDQGNPFLKPEIVTNTELSYSFKNLVSINSGISITDQKIAQVLYKDTQKNQSYQTNENIGKYVSYFTGITLIKQLLPAWSTATNILFSMGKNNGAPNNISVRQTVTSFSFSTSNKINIYKNLSSELNLKYGSPYLDGATIFNRTIALSIGLRKTFKNNKGSVGLSFTDILYQSNMSGITQSENIHEDWKNYRDTRLISMSLNYRFGQNKSLKLRKSTGADEEKSRAL